MINNLTKQLRDNFDNFPGLEKLYFELGLEIATQNNLLITHLYNCRKRKNEIQKQGLKSVSAFDRAFEDTDEYLQLKAYKYTIKALEHLKSSTRVRINGLNSELNNPY